MLNSSFEVPEGERPADDGVGGALALVQYQEPMHAAPKRQRCSINFGKPSERTYLQHWALAAHMREKKAKIGSKRKADAHAQVMVHVAQGVNQSVAKSFNVELMVRPARRGKAFGDELAVVNKTWRNTPGLKNWRYTPESMVHIAKDKMSNLVSLASKYDCSRGTARGICEIVCSVFLTMQRRVLAVLLDDLKSLGRPFFIIHKVKWDETSEKLSFGAGISATQAQSSSSWQVLVQMHQIIWGFVDDEQSPFQVVDLVVPPLPLISTSGASLFYTLRRHPMTKYINDFVSEVSRFAEESLELRLADGASGNDKLNGHLVSAYNPASDFTWCRSHANQLIQISMVATVGGDVLSSLTSWALFIHGGNHFLRLLAKRKQNNNKYKKTS